MRNKKREKAFIFYFLMSLILLDFGNKISNKISLISNDIDFQNLSLEPLFSISYTTNTGSAFGLFNNSSLFLIIIGIFAIIFLTFYVLKNVTYDKKIELISITLFSSGTLGNLIERIKYGYVIDYIKLNFVDFPVFNIFDCFICLGVIIYCMFILFDIKTKGLKNDN